MSAAELSQLEHDALIYLIQVDLNPININEIYYFHGYEAGPIAFNGQTYNPIAMATSGFEIKSGSLTSASITIASTPQMRALIKTHHGLRRVSVKRFATMAKYLNLPANINYIVVQPQEFFISRPSDVSDMGIKFELLSIIDLSGGKFPRGVMLRKDFPGIGKVRIQ